MLGKLFGGGPKKPEAPKAVDPQEACQKLDHQCEVVAKRIKVIENKKDELKLDAVTRNKNGDKRGALLAMKNMKMQEKELNKLDGQQMMLE